METDPRFDENDMMDGQDIPLGHKKFLLMRSELLKMIRTRELTRTRSHQLLAMLSEACDANFTRGYRCGLDDSEEEIKRLKEGYEGSCYACEPVGMKNLELENEIRRLREERDEARREAMLLLSDRASTKEMNEEYKKRGWEYLKDNP